MSIDSDDGFVVARTAEEAVDRLAELHRQATAALSQALKRYIKERIEPSEAERQNFHYPQLRIGYRCQGEVPSTTRAYAKVQVPGEYSVTVTHPDAFRKYLLEQLRPLMDDFTVQVQVGPSQQDIPYPYVVEQGDELAGSGVTAAELARVFPSTDLSAASDDIADGLYEWERADQLPLALFDAARVDFSLRRLVHYTGSDWRHVQPWILLTNYHRYVDQFIRLGLTRLREDPRFVRMVLPGNVIIERGMDEGEANAIVAGVVWHRYQMPAYHLIAADGDGITLVNIGVGPSNAKNITDHLAVLRPHCWLMIGHCGGLRQSQTIGDYVLAHAYMRRDGILDRALLRLAAPRPYNDGPSPCVEPRRPLPVGTTTPAIDVSPMPFSVPTHLSNPLRRFARRLVPDAAPEVAAPLPMPESLAGEPWFSVGRAVEALGGERVDGWILEEWRGLALRARFSACWRDPRGNLWNVLPQAGAIAFLADPQRRYEGVPLADQYQALSRDVLLEDYLGLRRQLARAGLDDEARERLAGMAARLESWLALGGRGDQACPCGSGKRYRNCCSRLVAPAS